MALRLRPGDQPLPRPGSVEVQSVVIDELIRYDSDVFDRLAVEVAERREVGISRYGSPLMTHNGRDACRDLLDELLDGVVYAAQVRMEGLDVRDVEFTLRALAARVRLLMDRRDAG